MYAPSIAAALLLVPLAFAQDTVLGIAANKAHITQSLLVPDLFASYSPSALLTIDFAGVGELQSGQKLAKEQAGPYPTIKVVAGNSSAPLNGTYTLAMVDAELPGSQLPEGQTRHWLVNGVKVTESGTIDNSSAVAITTYGGPWPASGSGSHRYVVVLYDQPSNFSPPESLSQAGQPIAPFFWNDYVKNSNLGPLVAANYFQVEEGTATVSASPTSSVVSATLAAASGASTSKGASGTGSAGGSSSTAQAGSASATYSRAVPVAAAILGMVFAIVM